MTGAVLLEGLGPTPHPQVPPVPSAQLGVADPQLHLPSDDFIDSRYAYWSVGGFPKVVNGSAAFQPRTLVDVRSRTANFPDTESVDYLRELGVRTVVVHLDLVNGTPWERAADHPATGLPLIREARGKAVVYRLRAGGKRD